MIRHLKPLFVVLFMLAAAMTATAEPLNEERIEGFLNSLGDLEALGKRTENTGMFDNMGQKIQASARKGDFRPMSLMIEKMRDHSMHGEFAEVVSRHGFDRPEDWAGTGDRIMRAMAAMELKGRDQEDVQAEMDAMMKQMENNPNVTEQQRKRMRQQMEQAMAGMKAMADAPQADIEAVRPYRDRIRKAMDE